MRQPAAQADGSGYFAPPTLVLGDLEGAEVWREEVFGPVLCAMPFESDEDAINLANASRFGLAHAVFSADEARAAKCAGALDAGVVWVNANQILWPDTPFGGCRRDLGSSRVPRGWRRFCGGRVLLWLLRVLAAGMWGVGANLL